MSAVPQSPVQVGEVIAGKFRIERVLGIGGMGVVVAAHHLLLGRTVALKFLINGAYRNHEMVARFFREGQALAVITSPNVARVLDVGSLPSGDPYLVMEYLDGADLGEVLEKRGRLTIEEATGYLLQVCEAVAEAHANGIVHRDLKPSNLFLVRGTDGLPLIKVLDFGISKSVSQVEEDASQYQTHTGALIGSPLYMSPEQIRNAKGVDGRTDIWSLGIILHEFLCGIPPFRGRTVSGTLAAVAADPPRSIRMDRPEVPVEIENVILKCLEKSAPNRYASVGELAAALLPFGPPNAAAAVARIQRVLSTANHGKGVDAHAATVRDLQSGSGTEPSWEGAEQAPSRNVSRQRALLGVSLGSGLLIAAVAGYLALRRTPVARIPEAPSTLRATAGPVSRALQPQLAPTPPAAALSPAPSASVVATTPVNRLPARHLPKAPPTKAKTGDDDGTSDRK